MGMIFGPFRSAKYGGVNLSPKDDSSPKIEYSGRSYEGKMAGDGNFYSTATPKPGYIEFDIVGDIDTYNKLQKMQDGASRSGVFTMEDGTQLEVNAMIDGDLTYDNGTISMRLVGRVRKQ